MVHLYHLSLSSSTMISQLIAGSFSGLKQQEILVVRNDYLEMARVDVTTGALVTIGGSKMFGLVRKVTTFKLPGSLKGRKNHISH